MISFLVWLKFAPEDRTEIAEMLRNLATASREEPGCVTFLPHQVQEDPNTVLIYEQYRDDQALAAHRDSAHFKKYVVAGLYQKMKERNLENLIALV
jgi:quinol monooxygenase YgiN